jgi:hypothetical protein
MSFFSSPPEYDIDNLFFIVNYCFFYLVSMSFFNHIIKLTEFIELNQVYNISLKFLILLKILALTKYFFFILNKI